MADTREGDDPGARSAEIRTFLIADIHGYTLFTQERGDEVAAKLAAKFADIAREVVEARGGTVLELRGDAALCVFASTRDAIRAAVDLQARFVEETLDQLPRPFGVLWLRERAGLRPVPAPPAEFPKVEERIAGHGGILVAVIDEPRGPEDIIGALLSAMKGRGLR